MPDNEDMKWRDVAMFLAGGGAMLVTLLVVPLDYWLDMVKNVGPIAYFGGMAILFVDKLFREEK